MRTARRSGSAAVLAVLIGSGLPAQIGRQPAPRPGGPDGINYLSFAQGAVPVGVGGAGARLGATLEHAVQIVDGDASTFQIVRGADATTATDFVYELPALTILDRLAVPGIIETPSPSITFTGAIEVHGSATSATSGFVLLATATFQAHRARGQITELPIVARPAVRWIRLRLIGGLDIQRMASSFEFSDIVGNGTQDTPTAVAHFRGNWQARGASLSLRQDGVVVSGCYDRYGDLSGTVTGTILRATGVNRLDRSQSAFILSVGTDGSLLGVRWTSNGPFRIFSIAEAPTGIARECAPPPAPRLGCGSIIHGITFGSDSAEIQPESVAVLAALREGLRTDSGRAVVIEGHTSSDGEDDHNLRLSERRAEAVVGDLVRRGLARERLRAAGLGERRPIAPNTDEIGRTLNRRVEVKCQ